MARTTQRNDLRRPLYATVGVTDRAVELVRESVGDLQARLTELQRSIEDIQRDPQELRARARELPGRIRDLLEDYDVAYDQLVARGDALVRRVRRQKATQDATDAARTTASKAKTTNTQARNAARSTTQTARRAARDTSTTARRRSKAPRSSAKATVTSAARTAKAGAAATADAAEKVGD